jgi:ATP-dependent Lon protease
MNPVIMLDEIDKMGADWRGDPSSGAARGARPGAEPLVPRPLPRRAVRPLEVMFIATANTLDTIPGPLLDRMEVIRFDGYTEEEKLEIAALPVPRQRERNGLREDEVESRRRRAARSIIDEYTREAGVRNLEREIGTVLPQGRARDRRGHGDAPVDDRRRSACATLLGRQRFFQEAARRTRCRAWPPGLAWTPVGGDVLFVEATAMPGQGQALDAHRPARRRDEGVGADRALLRARHATSSASTRTVREPRHPRPRAGGRDPEGRPERRRHDGDRARVAAHRPPGAHTSA